MSSWQKLSDMPVVIKAIKEAEEKIKENTGVQIMLHIGAVEILSTGTDDKTEILKDAVCRYFKVSWAAIRSNSRLQKNNVVTARHVFIYLASTWASKTNAEIGILINRHRTCCNNAIGRIKDFYIVGDPVIAHIEEIQKTLPLIKLVANEKV